MFLQMTEKEKALLNSYYPGFSKRIVVNDEDELIRKKLFLIHLRKFKPGNEKMAIATFSVKEALKEAVNMALMQK
jgi:hypothetical protein